MRKLGLKKLTDLSDRHIGVRFTVFTPTYNRANTIGRVYESLKKSTFRDFEWLVVDDGSTDNTKALIEKWQQEATFPIRYVWQPNGHKKKAFNHGVKLARGQFFLTADSDDEFSALALERFNWHWQRIPEAERVNFVGVCGLCQDETGEVVGDFFPHEWGIDASALEMRYRYRVKGEKWGFCLTEVLRAHPFPESLPGHVPEDVVWSSIAMRYKTRFVNEVFRVYVQGADNQIMHEAGPAKNAAGLLLWKSCIMNNELPWFWFDPKRFIMHAAGWMRFRLHLGIGKNMAVRFLPNNIAGIGLILLMAPVGVLWWGVDLIKTKQRGVLK